MKNRLTLRRLVVRASAGLALACLAPVSALAAGPAAPVQRSASTNASRLEYRLSVGDTAVYRIRYSGRLSVDMGRLAGALTPRGTGTVATSAESRLESSTQELSAKLHWKVVGVDRDGWVISARLQDAHLGSAGAEDERSHLAELPFVFKLARNGTMHDFAFRRGYPVALQLAVRGLVEPLQVVVDTAGADTWKTRESNSELSFDASYQRQAVDAATGTVRLTREKGAVALSPNQRATLETVGPVTTDLGPSSTTIAFSSSGQGVVRIEAKEAVTTKTGKALLSSHAGTYTAERVSEAVASLPDSAAAAATDLADASFRRARLYEVEQRFAALVEGRDTASILTEFQKGLKPTAAYGMTVLQNYVRRYPERTLELARALDTQLGDEAEHQVGYGIAAIAAAGHTEAQKALVEIVTGSGWTPLARKKALYAMIHLEAPEPFLTARIWALQSGPVPEGIPEDLYVSVVTNVYGSLGNTETADRSMTVEVVKNLGASLKQARDERGRVYALDGLSNVGDLALVAPHAAPYFTSSSALVRESAFSTFRRMAGDDAFGQFASRFERERSREVLQAAARTALEMPDTAARSRWARNLVAKPAGLDRDVLRSVTRLLGAGMKAHPENQETLKKMLTSVQDRSIRREIYAFVGPTRAGSSR